MTSCRIVDTRNHGGVVHGNSTRNFQVTGTTGFTSQGGKNGGCGVPAGATAVAITFTALSGSAPGFITAYPCGATRPQTRVVSFGKGVAASGLTDATLSSDGKVAAYVSGGASTNVLADVSGYYLAPMEGMIASDGSIYSGSSRIVSATVINPGVYRVTFDTDVSYCTPMIDTYSGKGVYGSAYGFAGTSVYVYTWYISGSTHLEVSNSYYFYITVTC